MRSQITRFSTYLWLVLFLFVFGACQEVEIVDITLPIDYEQTNSKITDVLCSLGFDSTDAVECGDHLVVGDVVFSKTSLLSGITSREKNNALVPSFIPSIDNIVDIPVSISSGFVQTMGTDWVTAIYSATSEFEQISDCRISFSVEESDINYPGGITVYADNDNRLPECYRDIRAWGIAAFPTGLPFEHVGDKVVFSVANLEEDWSPCSRQTLVMHEIGHTLGFAHPNGTETDSYGITASCQSEIEFEGQYIQATSNTSLSFMNGGKSCFIPLSENDSYSNVALYPTTYQPANLEVDIESQFIFSLTTTSVRLRTTTFTEAPPYRVEIDLADKYGQHVLSYTYYRASSYTKVLKNLPFGHYRIQATFYNFKGDYSEQSNTVLLNL